MGIHRNHRIGVELIENLMLAAVSQLPNDTLEQHMDLGQRSVAVALSGKQGNIVGQQLGQAGMVVLLASGRQGGDIINRSAIVGVVDDHLLHGVVALGAQGQ